MRDGVSQGVGTMARTAGMIAGSASDVSVNGHILEKEEVPINSVRVSVLRVCWLDALERRMPGIHVYPNH